MASLRIGHILKRNASGHSHKLQHGDIAQYEKLAKLWRNIGIFVGIPAILGCAYNAYIMHTKHHVKRPEYRAYEYLHIRTKKFFWGDGNHSLFHNPKVNPIPGVGYEEDE